MALDIRSFFIGIATVVGLLAVGFGSGVMMGGVISGDQKAPNKIERQAGTEPTGSTVKEVQPARDVQPQPKDPGALARDLDAIKPTSQPTVVSPAATSEPAPQQAQPAPGSAPDPVSTQPAPPPAPKAIAEVPAQPAPAPPAQQAAVPPVGAQKPVSLVQPADQQFLSRREHARLRAQQRREERAQRRELRRQQIAERRAQERQRRDAERAAVQSNQSVDDDDGDDARLPALQPRMRPMPRPRGLFGLFPF